MKIQISLNENNTFTITTKRDMDQLLYIVASNDWFLEDGCIFKTSEIIAIESKGE